MLTEKKTTDEFLQFIEDPSVDDRKNLKIKEGPINKSLESSSDIQPPLQNVRQQTTFPDVNLLLTEDDNQNSAVSSLPDTAPGPDSLL